MMRVWLVIVVLFMSQVVEAKRRVVQEAPDSITIMAVSSLTNVMTELISGYSVDKQLSMIAIYDSPTELEYKIHAGDAADLYIGEHPMVMRDLKRSGALNVFSMSDVAANKLVLVASKESRLSKENFDDKYIADVLRFVARRTLLHMAEPDSTWLGYITKSAFESLEQWKDLSRFVVRIASARNTLYLIDKAQSVGVVYRTDALTNADVNILASFDPSLHEPVVYQAALVVGDNMKRAQHFVDYLQSDEAQKVFEKHGFLRP